MFDRECGGELSHWSAPIEMRACCSSRVKAVSGTSSDTGSTVTVDRLDAGFPASHLLPGVCRARLRAAGRAEGIIKTKIIPVFHPKCTD